MGGAGTHALLGIHTSWPSQGVQVVPEGMKPGRQVTWEGKRGSTG